MEQNTQEIKKLIESGFSIQKIAHKLNLSRLAVKEIVMGNRFELKKEQFDDSKINYIVGLYSAGVSAKQLGFKFSIDKRRIKKWVKQEGKLRSRNDSHRITYFNQNYFDIIDCKEKAYWLGFLYADAYNGDLVNTITISLNGNDENHLKKMALEVDLPVNKVTRKITNGGDDVCILKLYSQYMCRKLTEIGCPRAKSFVIIYPEWLENQYHNHFIRGMFDGDGCLTFRANKGNIEWKWSLSTTKECGEKIKEILKNIDINSTLYYTSETDNNTYELSISGNEQIKKLLSWLYNESTNKIRLDRKYNRYLALCEQQENKTR